MTYARIPEEDYQKALGQLRLQMNGVFSCFRCYGMDVLVGGAIEEAVHLSEQFAMRVRGKEQPIQMKGIIRSRPTD